MIQKTIIGKNQSRKNWVLVKCTRTPKFNCYHKSQIFALRMYQWFDFCKYEKKWYDQKGTMTFYCASATETKYSILMLFFFIRTWNDDITWDRSAIYIERTMHVYDFQKPFGTAIVIYTHCLWIHVRKYFQYFWRKEFESIWQLSVYFLATLIFSHFFCSTSITLKTPSQKNLNNFEYCHNLQKIREVLQAREGK